MAIVAQIMGGLGNQLFIYAMGRAISLKNNVPLKLDVISGYKKDHYNRKFLLGELNIASDIANKLESNDFPGGKFILRLSSSLNSFLPFNRRWILSENSQKFEAEFISAPRKSAYLIGYWQSYKYFQEFAQQVREGLTLKVPLNGGNLDVEREILNSESVSVHVRQDNLSHRLNCDYYFKAVEMLKSRVRNPRYFIFSDSPGVSAELSAGLSARLVNVNGPDECCKDLALMSHCRHHIIANSTFSWWGAWLADSEDKCVIAPQSITKFNSDIIPPEWTVLAY